MPGEQTGESYNYSNAADVTNYVAPQDFDGKHPPSSLRFVHVRICDVNDTQQYKFADEDHGGFDDDDCGGFDEHNDGGNDMVPSLINWHN